MKLKINRVKKSSVIVYTLLTSMLILFYVLPSFRVIKENFDNSLILIFLKFSLGLLAICFILLNYFKGCTTYIKNLDISESNIQYSKWLLKANNLKAFVKSAFSITPFLIYSANQGQFLNNHISNNVKDGGNISPLICIIEDFTILKDKNDLLKDNNIIELFLNNNEIISFIVSTTIVGLLFSSCIMAIFYIIFKISMNKYFRQINKIFNHITKNAKKSEKELEAKSFEKMVIESEIKQQAIENDRFFKLYAIISQKQCDFWKEVKKSTTPPHIN